MLNHVTTKKTKNISCGEELAPAEAARPPEGILHRTSKKDWVKNMKKLITGLLIASMLMALPTGCAKTTASSTTSGTSSESTVTQKPSSISTGKTEERTNGKQALFELKNAQSGKTEMSDEALRKAYSEFVLGVMKRCVEQSNGRNVTISADSMLFALEMTAAGADGETLKQMTQTMVPGAENETALKFALARMQNLQNNSLKIANSVWLSESDRAYIYDDYLSFIKKNFDATADSLVFGPEAEAVINKWVEDKTEGRIKDLVHDLGEDTLMVLVNAISFDGKWKKTFSEDDIYQGKFTTGTGATQEVTFLTSEENIYLSNGKASGFVKNYDDSKYAFMTILPDDEKVDINQFIADMTPEEYWAFWESQTIDYKVHTTFPEFKNEYDVTLNDILIDMGMTNAFDPGMADFSNMTGAGAYISKVVHKTYIDVNRYGTEAAAATAVIMNKSSINIEDKSRYVICNRPFAYAIVDKDTGLPVFLGTVENVK